MNTIDSIQVSLNAGGMNTINIILAFVMYGVALGIKPHIFVEVFRKPKSVLLGRRALHPHDEPAPRGQRGLRASGAGTGPV